MIPEFLGRLPIIFTLKPLDKDMMVKILKEPRNAILKQYQKLLALDEVKLDFDQGALEAIAERLWRRIPEPGLCVPLSRNSCWILCTRFRRDDSIGEVVITREYIEGTGGPIIRLRGQEAAAAGTK